MVRVPDDAEPDEYVRGIIIGPPDLSMLGLSQEIEDRLHHELFVRGFITKKDTLRKREEILAALQSALILTVDTIVEAYPNG